MSRTAESHEIPNTTDAIKLADRVENILNEITDLRADLKQLWKDAKNDGMSKEDIKTLKAVIQIKRRELSEEYKESFNIVWNDVTGQGAFFA